nr:DUF3302 domain-containing protein [Shewanella sp. SR44-3]
MFLDYFALGILFFVVIVIFYGIIVIHDIPDETRYFAGAFWQNSLLRLKEGDEAEVIIDAMPGQVFKGRVATVLPAMAEGEVQFSGNLQS